MTKKKDPQTSKIETKVGKKILSSGAPSPAAALFYAIVAIVCAYILGSTALDSGNLWQYAASFAAIYYTLHFIRLSIKGLIGANDKSTKTRRTSKAKV